MIREQFSIFFYCLLLAFMGLASGASSQQESARADDSSESGIFFDHPYVPGSLIESALKDPHGLVQIDLPSVLSEEEDFVREALQRLRRSAEKKRRGERKRLDSNGCSSYWPSDEEWAFASTESGSRPTMEDLFTAADRVLIVHVTEVQSVLLTPDPGRYVSLVGVEILEDFPKSASLSPLKGQVTFADPKYSLNVGGTTLCVDRQGFHTPTPGDRLALLIRWTPYLEAKYSGDLWVTNVFPIVGDEIQAQPYAFLETGDLLQLDALREARSLAGNVGKNLSQSPPDQSQ